MVPNQYQVTLLVEWSVIGDWPDWSGSALI